MHDEPKARWLQLCEQAAVEQDPATLLALVRQINDILSEKQRRLEQPKPASTSDLAISASESVKRILLADDSRAVRATLKNLLLEKSPTWEISEAENGGEALEKTVALRPAVVVLDLNLPDMPGHEAARQIRQLSSATKIVLCSLNEPAHLAAMAQHIGADGYFTKTSRPEDLHRTILSVLEV